MFSHFFIKYANISNIVYAHEYKCLYIHMYTHAYVVLIALFLLMEIVVEAHLVAGHLGNMQCRLP